jgi:hypothetical protein
MSFTLSTGWIIAIGCLTFAVAVNIVLSLLCVSFGITGNARGVVKLLGWLFAWGVYGAGSGLLLPGLMGFAVVTPFCTEGRHIDDPMRCYMTSDLLVGIMLGILALSLLASIQRARTTRRPPRSTKPAT